MKYSKILEIQFSKKRFKKYSFLGFLPAVNGLEKVNNKKDYEPFFLQT